MVMLDKFKESRVKGEEFGAFFTNLSKASNCIDHNLLITKLSWYGVTPISLKLIFSNLSNRTQCVRINNSYSGKSEVKYGVPQGLVLGPLLFNIDLIELFLECKDDNISSCADDTTPYPCAQDISSVISELQRIIKKIFDWCRNNHMKANPEKCHVILSSNTQKEIRFANASITSSPNQKLLGIALDSYLEFEEHINKICNIVNKKLNALYRSGSHTSFDKRKVLLRAFIESQFSYCSLIWMFHLRALNNKINRLHEKALRIVHGYYKSKFDELL